MCYAPIQAARKNQSNKRRIESRIKAVLGIRYLDDVPCVRKCLIMRDRSKNQGFLRRGNRLGGIESHNHVHFGDRANAQKSRNSVPQNCSDSVCYAPIQAARKNQSSKGRIESRIKCVFGIRYSGDVPCLRKYLIMRDRWKIRYFTGSTTAWKGTESHNNVYFGDRTEPPKGRNSVPQDCSDSVSYAPIQAARENQSGKGEPRRESKLFWEYIISMICLVYGNV